MASRPASLIRTRGPRMKPSATRSGSFPMAARTAKSFSPIVSVSPIFRSSRVISSGSTATPWRPPDNCMALDSSVAGVQSELAIEGIKIIDRFHLDKAAATVSGSHGPQGSGPAQDAMAGYLAHLLSRHPAVDQRQLDIAAKQRLTLVRQAHAQPPRKRTDGGNGGDAEDQTDEENPKAAGSRAQVAQGKSYRQPPHFRIPGPPRRRATRRCGDNGGPFPDRGSPAAASIDRGH